MIRLTRQTDYGIVLMTRFAAGGEASSRTARELALETRLPLPMVSKILKALSRERLLVSHRGVKGGYRLARRPEDTSVAEVVRVFEGPFGMTECTAPGPGNCEHEPVCPVRSNWQLINEAVRAALESLTLADMARPLTQGLVTLQRPTRRACAAPAEAPSVANLETT